MSELKMMRLGEIAEVKRGSTITRKQAVFGEVPVIAGGQTPSCYHNVSNREGKTITVSASGAYAGFIQYFEIPIFASDCSTIQVKSEKIMQPKFLHYMMLALQREIYGLQRGSGQPHVYASQLVNLLIPTPPIDEQNNILNQIESDFSKLKTSFKDIKEAKIRVNQFRRSVLQAGLSGYLSKGDKDPSTGFPVSWKSLTLEDVASWTSGGTPSSKNKTFYGGDIPWVVIGDLNESVVVETEKTINEKGLESSSAKLLPAGTLMLAMYGASIGKTGVMGRAMATNQAIACGIAKKEVILEKYLLYFLQSQKNKFINAGKGGAQPNISQGVVKSWPITVPSLVEQSYIISEIDNLLIRMNKVNHSIEFLVHRYSMLKASILKNAYSGNLKKGK